MTFNIDTFELWRWMLICIRPYDINNHVMYEVMTSNSQFVSSHLLTKIIFWTENPFTYLCVCVRVCMCASACVAIQKNVLWPSPYHNISLSQHRFQCTPKLNHELDVDRLRTPLIFYGLWLHKPDPIILVSY